MTRVLVVYGSESGNARRGITKIVNKWKESGADFTIEGIVAGNSLGQDLSELKSRCDVLLVSCSSFGEGDLPSNYNHFLLALYRAAEAGGSPLEGVQHAVLGYGASVYETFQNCPRLTDKLLESCGSRRLAQRVELDEGSEDDPVVRLKGFETSVYAALQKLPAAHAPHACKWDQPCGKVVEKSEEDLLEVAAFGTGEEGDGRMGAMAFAGMAVAVGLGLAGYKLREQFLRQAEAI